MSRKQFVESQGATCKNWNWSWSFINEAKKFIIFGVWDQFTDEKLFSETWAVNAKGKKSKGYGQSREHIRLIDEEGYRLMTFPMQPYEESWQDGEIPKIKAFTPELTERTLRKVGVSWYATDADTVGALPEELTTPEKYPEGARRIVTINAYERNPKARAACIEHHGYLCAACGFDFALIYGELGKNFIHVHHIKPIGEIGAQYEIDPKKDLIPICPNCHAMVHRTKAPLTTAQLRKLLEESRKHHCQ
jgi:5-methylcytosine-specific restriction protein A